MLWGEVQWRGPIRMGGLDRTSEWRNSQAYERAIMWHTYMYVFYLCRDF